MANNKKSIDLTNELKYSLDIMHEQSRYAETKNASMIVFTSAIFIGIISNTENIKDLITFETDKLPCFNEIAFKTLLVLILLTNIASFICSLLSFLPKINHKIVERGDRKENNSDSDASENDSSEDKNLAKHNVLFFDTNTTFDNSNDLYTFYSIKYSDASLYDKDISNQIFNLSKIAKRKYDFFNYSLKCFSFGFPISFLISFIVWLCVRG